MSFHFHRGVGHLTVHHHTYTGPVYGHGGPGVSFLGSPGLAQVSAAHLPPPSTTETVPRLEASKGTGKARASSFVVVNHPLACEDTVDAFVASLNLVEYSQPSKVAKALRRLGRFCSGNWDELKRGSTVSRYVTELESFAKKGFLAASTVRNEVFAISMGLRALAKEFPHGDTFAEALTELRGKRRRINRSAMKSQNVARVARLQRLPSLRMVRDALDGDPGLQESQVESMSAANARKFLNGVAILHLYAFGNFTRKEALCTMTVNDLEMLVRGRVFASGALKNYRSFEGTCAYVASMRSRQVLSDLHRMRVEEGASDDAPAFVSTKKVALQRPEQCMTFALSQSTQLDARLATTDFRRIVERLAFACKRRSQITEEERLVIAKSQNHSLEVADAVYAGQAGSFRPDLVRQEREYLDDLIDNERRASEIIERMVLHDILDEELAMPPVASGSEIASAPVSPDAPVDLPESSTPAADAAWSDDELTLAQLIERQDVSKAVTPDDASPSKGRKCCFVACNHRGLPAVACVKCKKKPTHHLCAIAYAAKYHIRPFDAPTYCNTCLRRKMKEEKNWSQLRRGTGTAAAAGAAQL